MALSLTVATCAFFLRAMASWLSIPRLRTGGTGRAPDCMAVIPARDEQDLIATAVSSLPHDSVIVVDDDSKDATADNARNAGAGVIKAPELASGALGKSNACLAGARLLTSRWILFADADAQFAPGFVDAAVATAETRNLAYLSIHLNARSRTFAGHALAPLASAFTYAGMRPNKDPISAFLGQCILARRDAYEFLGGHAAVLNIVAEDMKLAWIADRHRLKIGSARAGALGWARFRDPGNSLRRSGFRLMLLPRSVAVTAIAGSIALVLWPASLVWVAVEAGGKAAAAMLAVAVAMAVAWDRGWFGLLMPLAGLAASLRLWSGLARAISGQRIQWKGRRI
jgi:chlorobactene glucosyltransferase